MPDITLLKASSLDYLMNLISSGDSANQATLDSITVGMRPSPNIFDANGLTADLAINEATGAEVVNVNSVGSGFIPVLGGQTYRFSTLQRIAWYTAARAFISGGLNTPGSEPVSRTSPSNARFMRLSLPKDGVNIATFMATRASEWPDSFIGYGMIADLEKTPLPTDSLKSWWLNGFLEAGKNLANEATSTLSTFVNSETGLEMPNASLRATALIPVEGGATYSISGGGAATVGARAVAEYNAGGVLIPKPMVSVSPLYRTSVTLDANTRFVRVSYHNSAAGQLQVEIGAAITIYRPYSYNPVAEIDGVPVTWNEGGASAAGYSYSYGLDRLRESRTRLMAYCAGLTGRQAQLHIGLIGDSWMMIPAYYARHLSRSIWGRLLGTAGYTSNDGMIGRGYHTLRNANASGVNTAAVRFDAIGNTMTVSGVWTEQRNNQPSASINGQTSSQAGAYVEWTLDYALTPARTYTLHALGGSGVMRYRWTAAGAWTTIDLSAQAAGVRVLPLAGTPASGSGIFRLEVVSGSVTLFGVMEIAPNAPGVVISNLGGSGSDSNQWVGVNAAQFITAITATNCDLYEITLGTNDAGLGISPAQYQSNIRTIIERIRDARPTADILLTAPAQSTDPTRPVPIRLYAQMLYDLAQEMDVAFIDLQPSFGAAAADYTSTSARPYYGDAVHPNQLGALARSARLMEAIGLTIGP